MGANFGRHFMADLYLCQNPLWHNLSEFSQQTAWLAGENKIAKFYWLFSDFQTEQFIICGNSEFATILLQIVPENNFLTIDLFSWQPQFNLQPFNESLIELFEPQVVVADCCLRGEHLKE